MIASGKDEPMPGITGLRGMAAAWVLLLHTWQFSGGTTLPLSLFGWSFDATWLIACGYFGVDLFFVLSGFLLSLPYHRAAAGLVEWPSMQQFWLRRMRRVLPAYWFQLLILVGVYAWLGNFTLLTPSNLFAHVALVQNLMPVAQPLLNPVYWSMPVEWDFYLVLPLLALLLVRARFGLLIALALVWSLSYRLLAYLSWFDPELESYFLNYPSIHQLSGRIDQFVYGMAAAWILVRRPAWLQNAAKPLLFAALAGLLMMVVVAGPRGDFLVNVDAPWLFFHHSLLAMVFATLILAVAASSTRGRAWFAGPVIVWLGMISYSLYLWHYPILEALRGLQIYRRAGLSTAVGVVVIGVPTILLVSWLSYRFIELPFLASRRRPTPQ